MDIGLCQIVHPVDLFLGWSFGGKLMDHFSLVIYTGIADPCLILKTT